MTDARSLVEAIWRAGVAAVDSRRLVMDAIRLEAETLEVAGLSIPRFQLNRIAVVGAGKAGAGMARGVEEALAGFPNVAGWINVPADCVAALDRIHLHSARPAGRNEPTVEGVAGSEEILQRVSRLGKGDLCLVLISGGGSALLPAPVEGITLDDKLAVIRQMSLAGATIQELNQVRRELSRIKGGGLSRACRAEWLVTLVISDVIGDPLETIASGPTIATTPDPAGALLCLRRVLGGDHRIPVNVRSHLQRVVPASLAGIELRDQEHRSVRVIGNNRTAIEAARREAQARGLEVIVLGTDQAGEARDVGREFAQACLDRQARLARPICLLSGGEPIVHVTPFPGPQKGGRNQELALAALYAFDSMPTQGQGITILSGGTDGEDGPTDAAGAFADRQGLDQAQALGLSIETFLNQHNSYEFFDRMGGLLKTGPTHTNVMDLRVAIVEGLPASDFDTRLYTSYFPDLQTEPQ